MIRLTRFASGLLVAAALTVTATGCGKSITSTPPANQSSGTTSPSSVPAPGETTGASTPTTTASSAEVGSDLYQVQSDLNQASNGSNQSDSDYQAGLSAQSQSDSP